MKAMTALEKRTLSQGPLLDKTPKTSTIYPTTNYLHINIKSKVTLFKL